MQEKIEVWNIFHDGSIVKIDGNLPNINIKIEINYLRQIFSNDGDSIRVKLHNCTNFQYLIWENKKILTDLRLIANAEPELLSVQEINGKAHITCVEGELDIAYENISFELDNGKSINIDELGQACNAYWNK